MPKGDDPNNFTEFLAQAIKEDVPVKIVDGEVFVPADMFMTYAHGMAMAHDTTIDLVAFFERTGNGTEENLAVAKGMILVYDACYKYFNTLYEMIIAKALTDGIELDSPEE